jgi:hypothetical protein
VVKPIYPMAAFIVMLYRGFFSHHEKDLSKMKYSEYIEVRLDKDSKVDDLWYYL